MHYTHYLPATGERGTLVHIPRPALRSQTQFEKAIGKAIQSLSNTNVSYLARTKVTLMDGTVLRFYDDGVPSAVFVGENGTFTEGYAELPRCSTDPDKTTRVSIKLINGQTVLTPFMIEHDTYAIINDIASGLGATFFDSGDQLTVIPCHNIQKAHIITSPYGG